ncbi:MAG: NADH dehydrogenase [Planctomycetes bacterium GWF2_50_10]|nr:MAG: NADH dehydrogenase [Planctomycetes bacterium GWF2_50_10]
MKFAWLIPAIPLMSFILVGLVLRPLSKRIAGLTATAAIFVCAALAYLLAWEYFSSCAHEYAAIVPVTFEWLRYQAGLSVQMGVLVDPISVLLMVVVTTVSALVHLYSIGYMHEDYGRFFTYLNLFTFSMLGLVAAVNIVQMYVFWELVGVSSFLLIGFYYKKHSAVAASNKAFIVTRFSDLGFLTGILILGYYGFKFFVDTSAGQTGPFDFAYLNSAAFTTKIASMPSGIFDFSILTLSMVLVFIGAAGKSAMFPLHIWLPDAMEGPTPVSALIHAATMVVAGVYLVARLFPAFAASGSALMMVAYVGAFTSLFAAIIGITQDDIKRVLAFSTLSQIGYMMLALGVATPAHPLGYTASMFHLFTHAFFKALLFLAAGAVIHAVSTNNIWEMGGLRKKMPVTHITFLIAALAIAGIYPFAGFFSKDEILASALGNGHTLIFAVALTVAALTAVYMFRIYFVAFTGKARTHHALHAHEAPKIMLIPLIVLAILSAIAGFVPMGNFVRIGPNVHNGINHTIAIAASAAAVLGIAAAWFFYAGQTARAAGAAKTFGVIYLAAKQKFYIDELYMFITKSILFRFVASPIAWFDRHIVDGGVNLSGFLTRMTGQKLRFAQTGQVQTYGFWFAGGLLLVMLVIWAAIGVKS